MSVASLGSAGWSSPAWTQAASSATRTPEAKEGPGPDRDGDSDDKSSISSQPSAVAAVPSGLGAKVNTFA
ncbi:MAG: hypothetical protein ACXWLV_08335 [Rhizomicrobium sp.]